ncbi:type VII secretion protein EccE [Longispora fulva]|uniref:Type VII secretion protein EccE n=1 Tax=Longispora fulva TaxID=619741 RepID=A0A8J7GFX1_9ACTN|nr:type VII secretion protein EccE [Longispora fulva]MBG6135862.1 type VII secretion protein EccE [Longispora fulva]
MGWQLAAVAVVLAVGRPWPTAVGVALAAVAAVVVTSARIRGRFLYAWAPAAASFLFRARTRDLGVPAVAGRELLYLLAPEATGGAEDDICMLSLRTGMTAVLRPTGPVPEPAALLPPDSGQPLMVQVVYHVGGDRPPRSWIALHTPRTVDSHADPEVRTALANAVRRVSRQLRRAGVPARGLPEHELLGTLAALAHVNGGRGRIREEWGHWSSGTVAQATYHLGEWADLPGPAGARLTQRLLTAVPQAAVTIAVIARRDGSSTATLRAAAPTRGDLERAVLTLTRVAQAEGIVLTPHDGRHLRALASTLPLGI